VIAPNGSIDDYPKQFRALMKPLNDVILGSFNARRREQRDGSNRLCFWCSWRKAMSRSLVSPHHEQWTTRIRVAQRGVLPNPRPALFATSPIDRLTTWLARRKVAVVNQSLVRKYFDGENPSGA